MTKTCPCDTGKPYDVCCGRFHTGRKVPTAAALMRSRYSAFVLHLHDYLCETWHPDTRPADLSTGDTVWLGLTIEDTVDGKAWDQEGIVEFTARYEGGELRERSHFVFDGRWLYVSGQVGAPRAQMVE